MSATTTDIEQDQSPEPEPVATAAVEPQRRWLRRSLLAASIVLVVLGAAATGAVAYDRSHRDEFLPGVQVGGLAVGGRTEAAVAAQLQARVPAAGDTAVRVVAGPVTRSVTLRQMGLRSDAPAVIARARADADHMGLVPRLWHRLLHKPVHDAYAVQLHVDRVAVRDQVLDLEQRVHRAPEDAKIDTSTGFVRIVPAVEGRNVDLTRAIDRLFSRGESLALGRAVADGPVEAPLVTERAKVTGFAHVILVRTGENRLYHYVNGTLAKVYVVATGQPKYPTPKGSFNIVLKRRLPTWVNPDPTGWGKSLPKTIAPGPGNPLGTRAMNLSAAGIRIHGTSNVASLGTPASHGCIRMAMHDVEELFELVDTGTPVIILQGAAGQVAPGTPTAVIGDPNAPVDLEAG